MQKYWSNVLLFFCIVTAFISACKKDRIEKEGEDPVVSPRTGTRMQFTLDSIFLYARQVYLWNDVLPTYQVFDPRAKYGGLSPDLNAFKMELLDISQLKLNPKTNKPYEFPLAWSTPKYSYLENGNTKLIKTAGVTQSNIQPPVKALMIPNGAHKVAYFYMVSFPRLSSCKATLDSAFGTFSAAKPSSIVIDLRSNSGGYIETAQYLADLIVPASLNGKVMFSEQYNNQMQSGKATILKYQQYLDENGKPVMYKGRKATMADIDYTEKGNTYKFEKKGNLETIKNVYFIVSGRTASASELLVSCLKPYFRVTLIGEKTYGKPVGFFGINIDSYTLYLSGFLIRNAEGWSDYFNGMDVDIPVTGGNNTVPGDPSDECLSAALAAIKKGNQSSTAQVNRIENVVTKITQNPQRPLKESETFDGMIESRLKLKK